MYATATLFEKLWLFLKLFSPMALTQFSLIAGSFVAVFLTGQYGTADLAGVSIGYNIWIAYFMLMSGTLLGITPIISQLLGAEKGERIPVIIQHGLYLATTFAFFMYLSGYLFLQPLLLYLNLEPQALSVCLDYMKAFSYGILPLLWVCTMRNVVDAHGYTHYSMAITVGSFFVSVCVNYALILGNWGFPALGGVGAGYGTALACWFNFIVYALIMLFKKPFSGYKILKNRYAFQLTYIMEQLRLGIPIGLSIFCEVSIFSIAGLLMAEFGTDVIAAHQAALSFTNLFYCFPLSISMAATIVVAYEIGARRPEDAKTYAYLARGLALVIAVIICSYSFTHLENISNLFTRESHMINLISTFLSYAVFFSVIDAFGTPIQGILRGYKDVRIISIISILCYWGICFPVAYIFSHKLGYGPYGVWIGLLSSVTIAGILFTFRVAYIQHFRNAEYFYR